MYCCVQLADIWNNNYVIYDEYKHVYIPYIYANFKQKQQSYILLTNVRVEPMSIEIRVLKDYVLHVTWSWFWGEAVIFYT
jgi:hypothetical protein